MNSEILNTLLKKDEDAKVIENTMFNLVVETSVNVGSVVVIRENEEEEIKNMGVILQVIRYLFMIIATISIFFGIFGIVPYFLLLKQSVASASLLFISLLFTIITNICMYVYRNYEDLASTLLLIDIFCFFIVIVSLSSYIQSIALLHGCIIIFLESLSVLIYNIFSHKQMNIYWAGFIMLSVGLPIWLVGILKQKEYIIYTIMLFTHIFIFILYSMWHIANCSKYHTKEFLHVSIDFMTNFYIVPFKWVYAKIY